MQLTTVGGMRFFRYTIRIYTQTFMDTQTPPQTTAKPVPSLSWSAPTAPMHDRSPKWYMYGALFVLACAVWGILTGNWTFTIVMLMTGGLYFLVRKAPVPISTITLTESGFIFDTEFTQWTDCESFWMVQTPAYAELRIRKKRGVLRNVVIQTGALPPQLIRDVLAKFLPESTDQGERLVDKIIRICKL